MNDPLEPKEGVLLDREGNELNAPRSGMGAGPRFGMGAGERVRRAARIQISGISPLARVLLAVFVPLFIALGIGLFGLLLAGSLLFWMIRSVLAAFGISRRR